MVAATEARLVRPQHAKRIAGVCAGVARYLGWSTTRVRIAFVVLGLFGPGEIAYLVLWLAAPKAP